MREADDENGYEDGDGNRGWGRWGDCPDVQWSMSACEIRCDGESKRPVGGLCSVADSYVVPSNCCKRKMHFFLFLSQLKSETLRFSQFPANAASLIFTHAPSPPVHSSSVRLTDDGVSGNPAKRNHTSTGQDKTGRAKGVQQTRLDSSRDESSQVYWSVAQSVVANKDRDGGTGRKRDRFSQSSHDAEDAVLLDEPLTVFGRLQLLSGKWQVASVKWQSGSCKPVQHASHSFFSYQQSTNTAIRAGLRS